MVSTIIHGTERVLAFAGQASTKKLLLTSSGAVYGRQPSSITHVPEEYEGGPDPLAPGSAYGEGKRISEHLCVLAGRRHGFEVKIARCFAFVGPHLPLDAHFAVGNFIRDILRGTPIQIGGDGTPYRSYLYAADLAIWLWTLLFRAPDSRAYNVGAAEDLTIAQIAAAVRDALKPDAEVRLASQPVQGGQPSRYVPSVLRAERELGLRASGISPRRSNKPRAGMVGSPSANDR
jgi:dTDP-glucose 4,6-dehydratase